jgi:hypothetical protein
VSGVLTTFKVLLIPRNLEIPYKLLDLTLLNNFSENKFNQIIMWSYPITILNIIMNNGVTNLNRKFFVYNETLFNISSS